MTGGNLGMPSFAVVGRVNKGKSSVIASLIENDAVKISPRPGTTTKCVRYDVEVDDRVLFSVIDTPGFEDAPRAFHWIQQQEVTAADRVQRVHDFVRAFEGTDEFVEERRLLQPILDGAAILYVVNGDEPYRENYETEMEVLRYTGRPAMALINRGESGVHLEEWLRALNQYFKLVRVFDAHSVTWENRRKLLEAFATLEPAWELSIGEALYALQAQQERRQYQVANIIADMLVEALSLHLTAGLADERALQYEKPRLERAFHDKLRSIENEAHQKIARVYLHRLDHWSPEADIKLGSHEDLFAKETWDVMGLSPRALLALTVVTGAAAGGAIDAAVGFASALTGTLIGGLSGLGVGVYELTRRYAKASNVVEQAKSIMSPSKNTYRVRVGPHPSLNFPFVLLARSLDHFDRVRAWAHAKREPPPPRPDEPKILDQLDTATKKRLTKTFGKIRKKYRDVPAETQRQLREIVHQVVVDHAARAARAG
jgi:small GTP-binding protein